MEPFPVTTDEFLSMLKILDKESERGCVLVGQAFLDDALETLLRAKLTQNSVLSSEDADKLLEYPGPLASFAVRSKMSLALSLLDSDEFTSLETIRKIRNFFAHSRQIAELSDQKVSALVETLNAGMRGFVVESVKMVGENMPNNPARKRRFLFALSVAFLYATIKLRESKLTTDAA